MVAMSMVINDLRDVGSPTLSIVIALGPNVSGLAHDATIVLSRFPIQNYPDRWRHLFVDCGIYQESTVRRHVVLLAKGTWHRALRERNGEQRRHASYVQ